MSLEKSMLYNIMFLFRIEKKFDFINQKLNALQMWSKQNNKGIFKYAHSFLLS